MLYAINSPEHKQATCVLTHIARYPDLLTRCQGPLRDMHYFDQFEGLSDAFDFACEVMSETGATPKVTDWVSHFPLVCVDKHSQTYIAAVMNTWLTCDDSSMNKDLIKVVIEAEWEDYQVRKTKEDLGKAVTAEEVSKVTEAYQANNKGLFKELKSECPFDDIEGNLANVAKRTSGVGFLDDVTGGGLSGGDLIGYLAPTGCGKTTFAFQVHGAYVKRREHSMYLSTEQKLRGDLSVRTFVNAIGVSRNEFNKPLTDDLRTKLGKAKPIWQKYSHFHDISEENIENIGQLVAMIEEFIKQLPEPPKLIVLDWWGRIYDQIISNAPGDTDKRRISRDALHNLKQLAERWDLSIIVTHQQAGASNARSASAELKADAQEDKSFPQFVDICIVTGTKDRVTNCIKMASTKVRTEANRETLIHLNGEYCRMEYAENPDRMVGSFDAGKSSDVEAGDVPTFTAIT